MFGRLRVISRVGFGCLFGVAGFFCALRSGGFGPVYSVLQSLVLLALLVIVKALGLTWWDAGGCRRRSVLLSAFLVVAAYYYERALGAPSLSVRCSEALLEINVIDIFLLSIFSTSAVYTSSIASERARQVLW